jgi:uncharacterized phage-associated protein
VLGDTPSKRRGRLAFAYDSVKADELAAHLLQLGGGSLPMLKLVNLMYIADRTSLIETGFPITGDSIAALDKGPILSTTYDRLKPPDLSLRFMESTPGVVRLKESPPADGRLSDYEIDLAHRIYKRFGNMTGQQLITYLHREAPEWKAPPPGSSTPIDPAEILRAAGKSDEEIEAIRIEAAYFNKVERRLA